MQYRRLHLALLLMLLGAFSVSGAAQTATYHLHREASTLTAADDKLLTAGPDTASLAITTALTSKVAGEYLIKEFETQTGDPATAGVIPSGSTLTFSLFMRKTASVGTVFPRAKIRLNNATGTLLCTATGATALTTTVTKQNISCVTTANISMTATDRFYLWVGVNLTATSATAFNGELDVEGTLNGNFDSTVVLPLGTPAPSITSLTPATGAVNTSVVIAGTNFRATRGSSTVTFNGIASTPTVWSATSITTPVPTGATTGPVVITVGGQASNASTFTVTPAPAITSLAPNSGAIGSVVTITGTNFGPAQGNGSVKFGTVAATVSSWSPTSIVATVPTGAVTGSVVVTAAGGVASAGVTFTVTAAPAITSVTPAAGGAFGSSFTITGTNFGPSQGNGGVTLNTVPATVSSWSATSIVAQVPSGVTSGNVVVTAAGGISSNGVRFKVLNANGLAVDQTVFSDGTATGTTRATAAFSTSAPNELLLAFVSSGKGTATTTTVTGVAGASLTWVLAQRTNTQLGTAEIWRAFAPTALTNVTVTATFSQTVESSMTVVSFTGADTSGTNGSGAIGATVTANAATGAPTATLTTTRANSAVFAVGDDPTAKVARTAGANQSLVHQFLCSVTGQTCTLWVQQIPTLIPASGTAVTINDTAPTADAWNLSLVEIKPAVTVVAPSITSLTPVSGPIGFSVTIAGSGFGATQGTSTVTFGGINAAVTSWSAGSIVAAVPAGVPLGAVPVVVTVPGAGTSNSVTFTVVNPLAISAIVSPLPNANGWNNTNVTVSYVCSGGVAPVVCPGPQTVITEGANQLVAATATDAIGEQATVSVTVSIDKTNPLISAAVSPAPVNGVVTAPATVTFTCSDALSGIASCPAPISVTTAGANQTFSGTATDRAGNSATASLTFSVETAVFSLTATPAPPANANGWNNTSVTITYACSGGVAPVQCPAAKTVTLEGANQVISATATDGAGQTASASTTLNIDKTAPIITTTVVPAPGAGGVVTAPAVITFVCSDALSGTASCSSPITVTATGAGQTFNGTATDKAGNTASTSVTLNVQLTPLTISASAAPAANAAGWNNTSVTVSFLCAGGVPPLSCPAAQTLTLEGANQIVNGTVTDASGQTASTSLTVSIDKTPPVITAAVTPAANAAGVVTAPATITFTCTDALSGVASCPTPISVTTVGSGQVFNGSATDKAGNTASTSVTLNVQLTPLTISASAAPAANAAGWNNTSVTVSFLCAGGIPPLSCPAAQTLTLEGANQIVNGTVTDASGQTASTSLTVSIDKTPPVITAAVTPAANAAGVVSAPATITFTCTDALSGIASCPSPISVTTAGAGQVFSGSATDKAGNTASTSVTLTVQLTPLTVTASAAPAANAAGWNNTSVTVSFLCAGGVPPLTCPAAQTVTAEGANQIISGTVTDASAQTASASITISIDETPPIVSAAFTPAPNANGVVTAPATITFTCSDALSGIAVCPSPITVTTAGASQAFSGTATDKAGNTARASVNLTVQTAPLTVVAVAAPPANAAGWNTSPVTVSFVCSGGVPPLVCPAPQTASLEGANQIISASVTDAAGQSASTSVTLNIDLTPPTISAGVSPVQNNSGIIVASSATITFTCTDTLSGVFNCPSPITVSTPGLQTFNGTATDIAGNTATTSVQVNLQTNPPLTVKASVSPTPNAAGWINTQATVSFQCDGGIPPIICPASIPVSTDGANQVFSGTATDASGATATDSVTINVDQTAPLLAITSPADGSVSPTVNIAVTGLVSDSGSGLASVTCNGVAASFSASDFNCSVQTTNGTLALSVQAVDVAGNTSTTTISATLQGPKLTITDPAPLALFAHSSITVTGTVDDPNAVVTVNGAPATIANGIFTAPGVILREGSSVVTATGTNTGGAKGTASVNVVLDTTPPIVTIDSPSDGVVVTTPQIYVTGMVNDVVPGSVNSAQVTVTLNGVAADVSNRTFMAEDILLVPGKNILTAVAKDRAGNVSQSQITVTLLDSATQQRILMVSGNGQTGPLQTVLPQPLVIQAINGLGQAIPNLPVTYTVNKSDGTLSAFPQQGRQITVQTDADGRASVNFQVGTRVGKGNNQVLVTSPGFIGEVMFCSTGTVGAPVQIHDIAGEGQTGVTGQPLAQPMVVVVFDVGGNAVPGVPVIFNVEKGGGTLEGSTTVTKVTDSDGRASATLVLAQEEGVGNNVVSASFDGLTGSRAAFVASGVTPKNADNTTVTGIVLDGGNRPVVNATASIQGTNLKALTDSSGRFIITNAPVGSIDLFIDGSTSTAGEPYPFLEFPMVTVAGQDNHLASPIYLPELDFDNSKVVGGDEDVTLTMKGMPGVQFTVLAHSATFPDGSKVGRMSVSQVHSDKVPMPPPNATAPHLFWTVQPPRVKFDPPMRIQIPNTEGLPAGTVTEIFCYNHDLEEFASGGTARVSEDGSFIVSDKGSGVIVSGWGDAPPPPPPPTCADGCGKCGTCKDGACVIDPPLDPVGVSVARSFGLPSETVDNINTGLAKLSTLGILASVNLLEVEGKVSIKECCDAELGRGFNTKGSVTGNFGGFTVNAKIWPPGPIPTIDVKVAVLGLASLEVKAQFVGGLFLGVAGKVEGEVGYKQNDCKEEDKEGCFFASLKVGVTFSASLQVGASVSVTTDCIFCVKTTTSAEGTLNLGKFSLPLNIAAISYNEESCHAGVSGGTWQFEPGTAEISATFKGKWEPEGSVSQGFNVTFNFLKCSVSLDTGIDCKSAL